MREAGVDQFRFEPTVFSAVRRYRWVVFAIALFCAFVAVGYTKVLPKQFRAHASLTVPQPLSEQEQGNSNDYLDSQVLLLQSTDVAQRAVAIANGTLGADVLSIKDFSSDGQSEEVTTPDKASPGTFGASTISVAFTWRDPRIAQVATNAVLQAFDDARSAGIEADGDETVAGIDRAMADTRSRDQVVDLIGQRTRALVNQQIDIAHHPLMSWAALPTVAINGNSKQGAAIGLLVGAVLGAVLAFVLASRRMGFASRRDPTALYGAPLIGEILTSGTRKRWLRRSEDADDLPMRSAHRSAAAEAFRVVASSIERLRGGRGRRWSLVFVSPVPSDATSAVVANVALAMAEGGTRLLAVDADPAGRLTSLLLPDCPNVDGFEQVVAGERSSADCIRASPSHPSISVLGTGPSTVERVTGSAYAMAVDALLAEAVDHYDIVLVDSPAVLRAADAPALVCASDAAVVVTGEQELVQDHRDLADRLDLLGSDILGYVYSTTPPRSGPGRRRGPHPDQTRPKATKPTLVEAGSEVVADPASMPSPVAGPEVTAEPGVTAESGSVAEPEVVAEPQVTAESGPVAEPEVVTGPEGVAEPEVVAEPESAAKSESWWWRESLSELVRTITSESESEAARRPRAAVDPQPEQQMDPPIPLPRVSSGPNGQQAPPDLSTDDDECAPSRRPSQ